MDSGVATRPIEDFDAYRQKLTQFVYHSGLLMKPIFTAAKKDPKRIVYAEGEDERVLRAVQVVVDEGLAKPILVGRPAILERRIQRFGLRLKLGTDFQVINPSSTRTTRATGPSTTVSPGARACRCSTRRSRCAGGTR